ncbi:MAG: dihydropteroate synthase [Treponemataceae bacterium]
MMNMFEANMDTHEKPILCGIVNVTPDSFSDGGKWNDTEKAVAHALDLVEQGAGMLDIGGESTRPGSTFVPVEEEIARVVPVITELKKRTTVPLSIDTWKSEVAKAALDAGADIVNDITGLAGDIDMAKTITAYNAQAVIMFNPVIFRPEHPSCKIFPSFNLNNSNEHFFPEEEKKLMKDLPIFFAFYHYMVKMTGVAREAGIPRNNIMIDPGIGFGLTKQENLFLIKNLDTIQSRLPYPIFLGVSRKRFLVNILEKSGLNVDPSSAEGFQNRDFASAILTAIATRQKVKVLRVHAIREHKIALEIGHAVQYAEFADDINFAAYK